MMLKREREENRLTSFEELEQDGIYVMQTGCSGRFVIKVVGVALTRTDFGALRIYYHKAENPEGVRNGQKLVWKEEREWVMDTDLGLTDYQKGGRNEANWLEKVERE